MSIKCPICETEYQEESVRYCRVCMYSMGTDGYLTNLLNHPTEEDLKQYKQSLKEYNTLLTEKEVELNKIEEENKRMEDLLRIEKGKSCRADQQALEEAQLQIEVLKKEKGQIQNEKLRKEDADRRRKIAEVKSKKRDLLVIVGVGVLLLGAAVVGFYNYLETRQLLENAERNTLKLLTEMVTIEGGTFMMGSEDGVSEEIPIHLVTIGSFLIGKYEVTQELWDSVMGNNSSYFKGSKKPVQSVSWYDAIEFCNKLSAKEGLATAYKINKDTIDTGNKCLFDEKRWTIICDFTANGYRLPTEAEWEYAAREGNKSKGFIFSGSNRLDEVGWYGAVDKTGNRTKAEGPS